MEALSAFHPSEEFPLVSMAGRTDRGLWEQFVALVPDSPRSFEEFLDVYEEILDRRLQARPPKALSGARELIHALEREPDLHPGLVTGNVEAGSRLKLLHCDLWEVFEKHDAHPSAFGHEDPDKGPLALKALGRWGRPARAVLLGDTPEDVRCARMAGIPCIGVPTGPFDASQLLEHGAEAVVQNLSDVPAILALVRRVAKLPAGTTA